jgi:hypothetical protein
MTSVNHSKQTQQNRKDTQRWRYGQKNRIAELKRLLRIAQCPASCNSGALYNNYGDVEQCQFCYERKEVLK